MGQKSLTAPCGFTEIQHMRRDKHPIHTRHQGSPCVDRPLNKIAPSIISLSSALVMFTPFGLDQRKRRLSMVGGTAYYQVRVPHFSPPIPGHKTLQFLVGARWWVINREILVHHDFWVCLQLRLIVSRWLCANQKLVQMKNLVSFQIRKETKLPCGFIVSGLWGSGQKKKQLFSAQY